MSDTQKPNYHLVTSERAIEIRDHPPMIFAEVEVTGPRKQAISEGG